MIYNVPIEKFEERYTEQWGRWFPKHFVRFKVPFKSIRPKPLKDKIEQGSFLDIIGTNYYKASQLRTICRKFDHNRVMPGDIFFFHDLWWPGLEALAYMRDALKINFRIAGILHAGSYDKHDMLHRVGMTRWAQWIEMGWLELIDHIFVATQFHKNLILEERVKNRHDRCHLIDNKIHITGLPIFPEFVDYSTHKGKHVVFPHRLDPEKNPDLFDDLRQSIAHEYEDWTFIKTKDVAKTKQEYYDILNSSSIAVSFADQETWGIAMQEAVMCGCIPLVPDRLSYQEMYPPEFRFHSLGQCEGMVIKLITDEGYFNARRSNAEILSQKFIMNGRMAIEKMLSVLEEI
jgi:glycosyltransferase involved in cell wall biosynthesis